MDLEFEVENQHVTRTDDNYTVNLSHDYLQLCFNFETSDWDGLSKFVIIEKTRLAVVNNKVVIPSSLLKSDKFSFTLYGVRENYRITTNKVRIYLVESGFRTDYEHGGDEDLDPDTVETIYQAINNHTHKLANVTDLSTVEMEVTYADETTDTFQVVVFDESD